jgi:catechol 2,3-dioxygenase-like lactoylglutathione lyase family enzyme
MKQRTTSITQVRTIAVPTTDQTRSLAFYTDVLGFDKTLDAPFGPGQRWIEVTPPGGGTTIALPPRGDAPVGVDTGIRLQTDDAAADHDALTAAGAERRRGRASLSRRPADVRLPRPRREHALHRSADVIIVSACT